MTKVEALEEEIKKLSREELVQLREWLLERDAQEWDRQVEQDAASGKLDKLFQKSIADHFSGKSREIERLTPQAASRRDLKMKCKPQPTQCNDSGGVHRDW